MQYTAKAQSALSESLAIRPPPKKTARLPHRAVGAVIVRGESDESALSLAGEVLRTSGIVRVADDIDMTRGLRGRG